MYGSGKSLDLDVLPNGPALLHLLQTTEHRAPDVLAPDLLHCGPQLFILKHLQQHRAPEPRVPRYRCEAIRGQRYVPGSETREVCLEKLLEVRPIAHQANTQ